MMNIIPTPKKQKIISEDHHAVAPAVYTEVEEWQDALSVLCDGIYKIYGVNMAVADKGGIVLVKDMSLAPSAYALDSGVSIVIRAADTAGVLHGIATALQLLEGENGVLSVQAVQIEDYPEKEYRAVMADVARRWHPLDKLFKYVDLCFFYKVNYLHLHLSDTQAYRYPSKAFPKLCREGEYYTFEEIARLNEYAAKRGVTLIPEVECPGHTTLLAEAYPDIFADHADEAHTTVCDPLQFEHGQAGVICAGSEKSLEGIKVLLAEVAEMFPSSPYLHIGGDEAPYGVWEQCVDCQAYMKAHGIASAHELYGEYVGRVAAFILTLGKTPVVWEGFPKESAHYIPKETIVIAWESRYQLPNELLDNGFQIVNASWKPLYIVPRLRYEQFTWDQVLGWNIYNWQNWHPKSCATLNPINIAPTDRLIGAELPMWEGSFEQFISRLLTNLPAFMERTWSYERTMDNDTYRLIFDLINAKVTRLIADR
ncbi:MAG: family 20 glycosylhydrolase [Clostridia bacterium]|nr:family 20 glycosylhydrolase [Clostridia bacterium]